MYSIIHEQMAELTVSVRAASRQVGCYVQGYAHGVAASSKEKEPFIFFMLKIKFLGTGVCLLSNL